MSTGKTVLGKSPGILLFPVLASGHARPPSEKLSPACWVCLVQGSKVLYVICKQVELCQKHPFLLSLLFLHENHYRTLNFGQALRLKHKNKINTNLNTQGLLGSLQSSCKTNFLFLLTPCLRHPLSVIQDSLGNVVSLGNHPSLLCLIIFSPLELAICGKY